MRSRNGLVCLLVFAMVLVSTHAGAQVLNGCVAKVTGNLRIVSDPSQCRENETPLAFNQVGPAGPVGPQGEKGDKGDPGPSGIGGVLVYDANNQFLGISSVGATAFAGGGTIFDPISKRFFIINPHTGYMDQIADQYFESSDCTGTRYIYCSHPQEIIRIGEDYYQSTGECKQIIVGSYIAPHDGVCRQPQPTFEGQIFSVNVTEPFKITPPAINFPVALPLRYDTE